MRHIKNIGSLIADIIIYTMLIFLAAIVIIPFVMLFNQSIMTAADTARFGLQLIPTSFTTSAYEMILINSPWIWRGFVNSFILVSLGTSSCLFCTCLTAFVLSKKYLPYRKLMTFFIFIPMLFSGGLIPLYLVVTGIGLVGTYWAIICISLVNPWYTFLMRNFFMQVPEGLEESARIDGASDLLILFRIILPISLPSIATIALFYGVGFWNSWFEPGIFLSRKEMWPLQVVLREIVFSLDMKALTDQQNMKLIDETLRVIPKEGVKAAAISVSIIPVIMVYPFVQKYFVKGLLVGSIKG